MSSDENDSCATIGPVSVDFGVAARIERRLATLVYPKLIRMRNTTGVISFCFDDVLQSACRVGREVLERYDSIGTFYVCGGLTGGSRSSTLEAYHTKEDLKLLLKNGHDLGCHGYAHINYQAISIKEVIADIERNREFFRDLGCDMPPVHFAYPYGCVKPAIKRLCRRIFTASRGAWGGVNQKVSDLALLRAVSLYNSNLSETAIVNLIEMTEKKKGWLIFFTHGVGENAGPFDCTERLLDFCLRTAVSTTCRVLPVRHALGYIAFRQA